MLMEEAKTLPFGDVWTRFCEQEGVPAGEGWFAEVMAYEDAVLKARG